LVGWYERGVCLDDMLGDELLELGLSSSAGEREFPIADIIVGCAVPVGYMSGRGAQGVL